MYGDVAEKYNKTYAKEISYLLYCGVLKQTDLADYASATQSGRACSSDGNIICNSKQMGT